MGLIDYNSQLIINLLTGTNDDIITSGSNGLHRKFVAAHPNDPAQIITLQLSDKQALLAGGGQAVDNNGQPVNLGQAIAGVGDHTRLYIRGHGDWAAQTVGGWSGPEFAQLLATHGLPTDRLINVTGCKAGSDSNATPANGTRVTQSMDSFAAQLHRALRAQPYGLECMVVARVYYVTVMNLNTPPVMSGTTVLVPAMDMVFKVTRDEGDWVPQQHRAQSKVLFYWDNGQQVRKWWDYNGGQPDTWQNA